MGHGMYNMATDLAEKRLRRVDPDLIESSCGLDVQVYEVNFK
jgi:hypothetical protein